MPITGSLPSSPVEHGDNFRPAGLILDAKAMIRRQYNGFPVRLCSIPWAMVRLTRMVALSIGMKS